MTKLSAFFILLPLYIYPSGTAWQPLLTAAASYPHLSFRVIINPDDGPGYTYYPDALYISHLAQLNNLSNVAIYGYVAVSAGARAYSDVISDVGVYAGWANYTNSVTGATPDISVDGIFFDECPTSTSELTYMANVSTYARTALANSNPNSTAKPSIIFNTGLTTDQPYYAYADYVNAYEGPSPIRVNFDVALAKLPLKYRKNSTVLVTDFTGTMAEQKVAVNVFKKEGVKGVFVTTRTNYYNFSGMWTQFVEAVHANLS